MEKLTQAIVDETFNKAKIEWDTEVGKSGLDERMFIQLNRDGWALDFLAKYQFCKEALEGTDMVMPVLVEGIKIKLVDKEVTDESHI